MTCGFGEYTSGCCCKQSVVALLSKQISSRDFHHEMWSRPDIWNVSVLFCCTRRQSGANATRWKPLTAAGYMTEGEEKAESSSVFSPGNLTTRTLTKDKFRRTVCEVQLAIKVEQNRDFAGSLGVGVRQNYFVSALRCSWAPIRTHHYTKWTFCHPQVS